MLRRRLSVLATVGLFAVGCGDDGGSTTPDAGSPDAPPAPTCAAGITVIDLDTAGTHAGTTTTYSSTLTAGAGMLDYDDTNCADFPTLNEAVHSITIPSRSRVRITNDTDGTPALDSVIYVRSTCTDAMSELACNDDQGSGNYQSAVTVDDVAAGTVLFVVVDSLDYTDVPALPQPYELVVALDPILPSGQACDPTGVANLCEPGLTCSTATGSPICSAPLGGPTVSNVAGTVRDNGSSMVITFTAADPDGDIATVMAFLLDGANAPLDLNDDGNPDEVELTPVEDLTGQTSTTATILLRGLSTEQMTQFRGIRLRLIDSTDMASTPVDGTIVTPTFVAIGGSCGMPTDECRGELMCSTTCTTPAATGAACAAADAGTVTTGSETFEVTIAATAPDNFQGSCYWDTGLGEAVRKIVVGGTDHVRFEASTDVAPSPSTLDTYIYLRQSCGDPLELGCNDDAASATISDYASTLVVADLAPGTYYLVVDGSSAGGGLTSSGTIGVKVTMTALKNPGASCIPGTDLCTDGNVCYDPAGGTAGVCRTTAEHLEGACAAPPALLIGMPANGTLDRAQPSILEGSCRFLTMAKFPEDLYTLTLTEKSRVTLSTDHAETNVDTLIYINTPCSPAPVERACHEDVNDASNLNATLVTTLDAGVYTVVVDMASITAPDAMASAMAPFNYRLTTAAIPVLGSGMPCDPTGVANICDTGLTCPTATPTCQ